MRKFLHITISFIALTAIGVGVIARDQWPIVVYRLLLDGSVLIAWMAAMAGWGAIVRSICARRIFTHRTLLDWIISIALGIGSISLLALFLGLSGAMNQIVAWTIIAIGVMALAIAVRACSKPTFDSGQDTQPAEESNWDRLWLLAAPVVSIALVCAFVPPGVLWGDEPQGYDVLEYHLQVPREWFEAGRITALSHNVFSYVPMNVEMHYLLAMHLRGGPWDGMYLAQLMHASMIALAVLAIYALAVETAGPPAALLATNFMLATPWLILLAPIAYDEGGVILFGTLAIGLVWKSIRENGSWRDWSLAGAMCGFACGSKLTAVPMLLCAIPLASSFSFRFKNTAIFVVLAVLTFSPWCIRNFAWAKNPFFPETTEVFARGKFTEAQQERWQRSVKPPENERSISARFLAAGKQIGWDWRYGYALFPVALAGLIAVIVTSRRRDAIYLLLLLIIITIIWLCFTHLQSRFFVLAIPIAALAIAGILKQFPFLRAPIAVIITLTLCAGIIRGNHQYVSRINTMIETKSVGLAKLQFDPEELSPTDTMVLVGSSRAFMYSRPMKYLRYRTVFDIDDSWTQAGDAWLVDPKEILRLHDSYFELPPPPSEIIGHDSPFVIRK